MEKKKDRQKRIIARKINRALSFTNGWHISEEQYDRICDNVAKKILQYLKK